MASVFYALRPSIKTIDTIHFIIQAVKKEGGDPDNKVTWANGLDLHTTLIHFKHIDEQDTELVKGMADKINLPEAFVAKVVDVTLLGGSLVLVFEHDAAKKLYDELVKLHDKELPTVTISRHSGFIAHVSIGGIKNAKASFDEQLLDALRQRFIGSMLRFDRVDLMTRRAERTNGAIYKPIIEKPLVEEAQANNRLSEI